MNDDLFGDSRPCDEATEALINRLYGLPINYVGNKKKLALQILGMLADEKVEFQDVFDAFSGSCVVSLVFSHMGKDVTANDLLAMSSLAAVFYLVLREFPLNAKDIEGLLEPSDGAYPTPMYDKYRWKFFLPAEAKLLDSFRHNLYKILGRSNVQGLYTGDRIDGGKVCPSLVLEDGALAVPEKIKDFTFVGSFAMHALCTHVLQKCFLGGRYYNGQTICSLRARVKRGRTDKNIREHGNDMRTIIHRLRGALMEHQPASAIFASRPKGRMSVFNCDVIRLLESGRVEAELAYFDPPYGGDSSDYSTLYGICEEFIRGCDPMTTPSFAEASKRFCDKAEYGKNFSAMLDLSRKFPIWLFSFNESSYASIEGITSQIRRFRHDIVVRPIKNYGYNYRKRTHSSDRESEFLILARG